MSHVSQALPACQALYWLYLLVFTTTPGGSLALVSFYLLAHFTEN